MLTGNIEIKEHQAALLVLLTEFDRVCKALEIPYVLFAGTLLGSVRHDGFIPWDDDLDVLMPRCDYDRFMQEAVGLLDQNKFFLQREFSDHWPMFFSKLRLNGTTCLEKYHPKDPASHQGVYMDIFPCDNAAKSWLGKKIQFCASKVVIAKALDARGYDTESAKKKVFIRLCRLLPMKPFLHLAKAGREDSAEVHTFFGAGSKFSKNVFRREWIENRHAGQFEGRVCPLPDGYDPLLRILYGEYMKLPPVEERECKVHAALVDLHHSYEEYEHYREGMQFDVHTRSIR